MGGFLIAPQTPFGHIPFLGEKATAEKSNRKKGRSKLERLYGQEIF